MLEAGPQGGTEKNVSKLLAKNTLLSEDAEAAVFHLDGVLTRTQPVHAEAWKAMFDEFLARHRPQEPPFDRDTDYHRHVDGKPRHDGVRGFLEARGIELPEGEPEDEPGRPTVYGLGNRKNVLFLERLQRNGVEVYGGGVALVRALRKAGVPTAVVSSSSNCEAVLEAAGIAGLFDVRVDGRDLRRHGLAGKPAPDMFLEALGRLDSTPRHAIAVEDAVAGVAAAVAAGCGAVIGVDRSGDPEALRHYGAHLVVADLAAVTVAGHRAATKPVAELPCALDHLEDIYPGDHQEPALFLDYDGTLTPIVERPADAVLPDAMAVVLRRLAGMCEVAVVSGRDLADLRRRVGIEELWYAGSHGFDIAGPGGEHTAYPEGRDYLPALDDAERALREALAGVAGCEVERKRFALATHYRRVAAGEVPAVEGVVEDTRAAHPELRISRGRQVIELQPDMDWDQGRALNWLMRALDMDPARFIPIVIGDDVTDEDAFREVARPRPGRGVGIVVTADDGRSSRADYCLADPRAVGVFLERLADRIERDRP